MGSDPQKDPPEEHQQENRLKSQLKGLIREALGLVVSREKQKQLLGISLYRNASYLVITYLVVPVTSFFFWIIVARFYLIDDVGLASATISMVTLLGLTSTLGFEFGLVRYLANAGHKANSMVNTSLTLGSLAAIVFSCIFLAGVNLWAPELLSLRQNLVYFATFIVFTVMTTATILMGNAFVAQRRANFVMINSLISGFLRLPLPILLLLLVHSYNNIIISLVISGSIALFVSILLFRRTFPGFRFYPNINRAIFSEMIHFSFTNYVANMLWSFTIYILPLMVVNVLGAEANAYFFISWTIGAILGTISLATTTSLFAEGSSDEKGLVSDVWRCLKMTYVLLIPIAVIVFLLADKLLLIYGTTYSSEGTALLRTMTFAAIPLSLNGIYLSILRVKKKSMSLIFLNVFVAIATLVVSYLLLPRIGITGTGIGWLVSQSILAIFVFSRLLKLRNTGQFQ